MTAKIEPLTEETLEDSQLVEIIIRFENGREIIIEDVHDLHYEWNRQPEEVKQLGQTLHVYGDAVLKITGRTPMERKTVISKEELRAS